MSDYEQAINRSREMWYEIGNNYRAYAITLSEDYCDSKPIEAIKLAVLADICFFQSTGESDITDFELLEKIKNLR